MPSSSGDDKVMKADQSAFAAQMKKLINNKETSDIKFLIGTGRKPIYAHRCILSARCDVFRAMFADQNKKNDEEVPFVLSDVHPEVFMPMLEFIYTNCVTLNNKISIQVLSCAVEYGLDQLRKQCVIYIVDNLAINNACEAMQAAVTYGQDELREKTLQYIEENTANVFKSKAFHEMSEDALAVVLQSDKLLMDEVDILLAVREWATVNHVVLERPLSEVAKKIVVHIRLPLLSPDELSQVEKDNSKDNLIPMSLMSQAWRFHALKKANKADKMTKKRKGTVQRECYRDLDI